MYGPDQELAEPLGPPAGGLAEVETEPVAAQRRTPERQFVQRTE